MFCANCSAADALADADGVGKPWPDRCTTIGGTSDRLQRRCLFTKALVDHFDRLWRTAGCVNFPHRQVGLF